MATDFKIHQVYSMDVYGVGVLPNDNQNVTVLAVMDFDSANQIQDMQAIHVAIFPLLPTGTPNDPRAYNYLKLKTTSGQIKCLGIPWINDATVTVIESQTIQVLIGNVTASDVPRVRAALLQNGFNTVEISIPTL